MNEHYPYALPPLLYNCEALQPEISSRTLFFHHDKHFAAYVDNLNQLLKDQPDYQKWPLKKLCQNWQDLPPEIHQGIRNNAGGVFNHTLYFENLTPTPVSMPLPPLDGGINRAFGSLETLKHTLKNAGMTLTGSGWVWLCMDCDGELCVVKTANQNTPFPLIPLLCCDFWEHAYYLDVQNRRGVYFECWWKLINWPRISRLYQKQLFGRPPIPQP